MSTGDPRSERRLHLSPCVIAVVIAIAAWWGMLVIDGVPAFPVIYAVLIVALIAIGVLGRRWWTPVLGGAVLASPFISILWEQPRPCGDPCIDESFGLFLGVVGGALTGVGALLRWLIVLAVGRRRRRRRCVSG